MNTIQNLFQQALLAEAAYSNFLDSTKTTFDALTTGDGKFSQVQAAAFVLEWSVVDQYTATGSFGQTWTGTGFSATLFKNKTGQYNLAIRGSTAMNDFLADAALIIRDGIAVLQMVDMYNYWQRLNHAGVYTVAKLTSQTVESAFLMTCYKGSAVVTTALLELFTGIDIPTGYDAARAFFVAAGYVVEGPNVYKVESDTSTNLYTDPADPRRVGINVPGLSSVNVDGHSLGGHLAMAFSRLFPSATSSATAVNGLEFTMSDAANDADYVIARRAT